MLLPYSSHYWTFIETEQMHEGSGWRIVAQPEKYFQKGQSCSTTATNELPPEELSTGGHQAKFQLLGTL